MRVPVDWIARQLAVQMQGFDPQKVSRSGWWIWPGQDLLASRPQIVTLCGSTRFVDEFNRFRQYFTLKGMIVLSIEIVTTQQRDEDPQHVNRPNKEMLDRLHLEKIKISDSIFVINKGGYIGESTLKEIEFAQAIRLPIEYMEEVDGSDRRHRHAGSPVSDRG